MDRMRVLVRTVGICVLDGKEVRSKGYNGGREMYRDKKTSNSKLLVNFEILSFELSSSCQIGLNATSR